MYGKLAPSTVNCCFRGVVLFIVGGFLTLVLNILTILPEIQEDTVLLTQEKILNFFSGAWWVPICCGFGAVLVGLMYPCMDSKLGSPHNFKREWSSVARCVAIFVGINHASVKINFGSNLQLVLFMAALSVVMWWLFDRSSTGLGLGVLGALLATGILQVLLNLGVYRLGNTALFYGKFAWVPCMFFSGGITFGNIGRQLAMVEYYTPSTKKSKEHTD